MYNNTKSLTINFSFNALSITLFIVFLILKLCGVIAWSWWFVCLPLIISVGLTILILLIGLISVIIITIIERRY